MTITATTLVAAINQSQTSFNLSSVSNVSAPNFQTGSGITMLQVDQELMLVTGVNSSGVVNVLRGQNGTVAATHTAGSLVQVGLPSDFPTSVDLSGSKTTTLLTVGAINEPAINLTGSADAIPNSVPGNYEVKTAGVDAMTLAAPPASAEGNIVSVVSDTTNAHTITATSLFANGTALKTTATFAAFRGAGLSLRASNGVWQVQTSVGVTFT